MNIKIDSLIKSITIENTNGTLTILNFEDCELESVTTIESPKNRAKEKKWPIYGTTKGWSNKSSEFREIRQMLDNSAEIGKLIKERHEKYGKTAHTFDDFLEGDPNAKAKIFEMTMNGKSAIDPEEKINSQENTSFPKMRKELKDDELLDAIAKRSPMTMEKEALMEIKKEEEKEGDSFDIKNQDLGKTLLIEPQPLEMV